MGLETAGKLALGSGVAGGLGPLFAPEGQELQSFEGVNRNGITIDPADRLAATAGLAEHFLPLFNDNFTRDIDLSSSFVQQPAVFSGGGLPMDIGVTAFDTQNPFFSPGFPGGPDAQFGPGANANFPNGPGIFNDGTGEGPIPDDLIASLFDPRGGHNADVAETVPPPNAVTTDDPFPVEFIPVNPVVPDPIEGLPPVTLPPGGGEGGDDGDGQDDGNVGHDPVDINIPDIPDAGTPDQGKPDVGGTVTFPGITAHSQQQQPLGDQTEFSKALAILGGLSNNKRRF